MTKQIQLKHLQREQFESWLRKAEDPEWDEEKFGCHTRSKAERAAASLALELRDHLTAMAKKDEQVRKLREALSLVLDSVDYTSGACRLNEMVGATLPKDIIAKALEALEATND